MPRWTRANATLICALMLLATQARADDSGFYVGAGFGIADAPGKWRLVLGEVETFGRPGAEEAAWSLAAGYRFNRYFALEAGYVDLGRSQATFRENDAGDATLVTGSLQVRGATIAAIAGFKFGDWSPYLRAGALFVDSTIAFDGILQGNTVSGRSKGDSVDGFYALGIGYHFAEHWQAKLEATHYVNAGESPTGTSDFLGGTLSLTYRF